MRDLNYYGNYCIDNLNAIGIYPNPIKEFKVNTRAKKRWGQAVYTASDDTYSININAILLDEGVSELSLLDTLYHELLHCVDGCMNHGSKWTELADLVSDCYGIEIKRCSSTREKLGATEVANEYIKSREKASKVFAVCCNDCGKVYSRKQQRAPKWYVHTESFKCTLCNGKLHKVG